MSELQTAGGGVDYLDLIGLVSERPQSFAWLLGAGASASSGLPTATDIIWDLKRHYYRRHENQDISRQDAQNEAVRERIQSYMLSKGFPELWAPREYSTYFEKAFGDDYERQSIYLRKMLSEDRVALSVGNRVLGAMMSSGFTRAVFTTNFDTVVEKAVAEVSGKSLAAFHLEGSYAANDALNNDQFPIYCKLHGDFRYQDVKNLSADLRAQDAELGKCLVNACNRFGLVVSGYSGRDESVMALLTSVLATTNPFPHGLFWTGLHKGNIPPSVSQLLAVANDKGVRAEFVPIETFDTFMLRLWRNLDDKPAEMDAKVRKTRHAKVSIPVPASGTIRPLMRLNALPIKLPTQCLVLTLKKQADWDVIKAIESKRGKDVILTKDDRVWAWGPRAALSEVFAKDFVGAEPLALPANFNARLHLKAFFEKGLSQALMRDKPLVRRIKGGRTYLIADRKAGNHPFLAPIAEAVGDLMGDIPGLLSAQTEEFPTREQVSWAEAAQVSIEEKNGAFWLLINPDIWIWPKRARKDAGDFLQTRRANRYNSKADALLSAWCAVLLGADGKKTIDVAAFSEGDEHENPKFTIGSRTAFSQGANG